MIRQILERFGVLSRDRMERDMDDELKFHLAARTEDLVQSGLSREEAERRARREFGSVEKTKEEAREARGWRWIDEFRRNVRFGLRILVANPAFSVSAIVTLGICVGANTAVFSLVDAALFRPLPYPEPDRLAMVATRLRRNSEEYVQLSQDGRTWELMRDQADFLERAVFSSWTTGVNLSSKGKPMHVVEQRVGAGFFSVLGVELLAGREFTAEEDREGGRAVTVLSDSLAATLFGQPRSAVDQVIRLRGEPYLVVGVTRPGFEMGARADLWSPIRPGTTGEGEGTNYRIVVRLKDGISMPEAQSRMAVLGVRDNQERRLSPDVTREALLVSLQEQRAEGIRATLSVLWGFVTLVLVLGCVNVAGLLIARNGWRRREIAIRIAMGGGRGAVLRQMLTEGMVLAVAGAVAGVVLAWLCKTALEVVVRQGLGYAQEIQLDGRTMAFTGAVALVSSVLFGLYPAIQASRVDANPVLTEGGGRGVARGGNSWSRRILVVAQVALVAILLSGAGLLLRTFSSLKGLDPGFSPENVATARISLRDARYATRSSISGLVEGSLEEIRSFPGVEAAGLGLTLPYERALNLGFKRVDGSAADSEGHVSNVFYVTTGYFEALGMTLQRGRLPTSSDGPDNKPIVLVSESFVETYLGGEAPLGLHLDLSGADREIVGVVRDVQLKAGWGGFGPLGEVPSVYLPLAQTSDDLLKVVHTWFSPAFVVRSQRPFREVSAKVVEAVQSRDPEMPLFAVQPMAQIMADSWARQRVLAAMVASLAGLALLLAGVGIYGLIANSVVERRREMGIRMALGATVWDAVSAVALSGIWLTVAGIVVGAVAAYAARPLIAHLVWGVSTSDPLTFAGMALILLATAVLAALAPSLRIVKLDPAETLRD